MSTVDLSAVRERLPGWARKALDRLREDDLLLLAAGVAFYAIISVAPLVLLTFWIVSLFTGEGEVKRFANQLGQAAPDGMGLDKLFRQVADRGTSVGFVALLTALWPASAYGSGLGRAFERLSPGDQKAQGFRGRALVLAVVLPLFVLGGLVASYVGTTLIEDGALATTVSWVLALVFGFIGTAATVAALYRVLPPRPLDRRDLIRQTALVSAGIAVLSAGFTAYVSLGTNFKDHYATSGIATVVLIGLWVFLANALVLAGYRSVIRR